MKTVHLSLEQALARRRIVGFRTGLTLIELMVSIAILSVALVGVGMTVFQVNHEIMFNQDRALAHLAVEQVLDKILQGDPRACDPDGSTGCTTLNGTTFTVVAQPLTATTSTPAVGTIGTADMYPTWSAAADSLYLVWVEIKAGNVVYAHVECMVHQR